MRYEIHLTFGDINRFWKFVSKASEDDCWNWTGVKYVRGGYGKFWLNGRDCKAHRVAFQLVNGELQDGLMICHRCDNPACCNPRHLFQATQHDNVMDATSKGRMRMNKQGEKASNSKLKDEQVIFIRTSGLKTRDLAALFGLAEVTICAVRRGATWRHLPMPK